MFFFFFLQTENVLCELIISEIFQFAVQKMWVYLFKRFDIFFILSIMPLIWAFARVPNTYDIYVCYSDVLHCVSGETTGMCHH